MDSSVLTTSARNAVQNVKHARILLRNAQHASLTRPTMLPITSVFAKLVVTGII